MTPGEENHGLIAVFASPEEVTKAALRLRERGFTRLDAFTPFPVEGLAAHLGDRGSVLPWLVLAGGVLGFVSLFALEAYSVLVNYPINVGGRPLFSWPAFMIPAFEAGILGAALFGFFGMLVLNRLPKLYHPVFNSPDFSLANDDRFYLLVTSDDPLYDRTKLRRMFRSLGASAVDEVVP